MNFSSFCSCGISATPAPPKVSRSLENSLRYLDEHVDALLAALPGARTLSFVEVALFCTVTHLPFRQIAEQSGVELPVVLERIRAVLVGAAGR